MRLTLDNLDGRGALDYSAAIERSAPLTVERSLNAPSTAKGLLCLEGSALTVPVRQARMVVASDAGATLFTGYLVTEAEAVYAGEASRGAVYRLAFSAVSDEWLLDKQTAHAQEGVALNTSAAGVIAGLAQRTGSAALAAPAPAGGRTVGVFEPVAGGAFSAQAGSAAAAGYAAYRAVGGALNLTPVGSVTHTLSDGDGSLALAGLRSASVRELANDVTVSGSMEPAAYWTELFAGDGTTVDFNLAGEPSAPGRGRATLIADDFNQGVFNRRTWTVADPGSHLGVGAGGFTLSGGNGFDGQTTLSAQDAVELGGTLVLELAGVTLAAGSTGVLGGLYQGAIAQSNCLAGFNIAQAGGNTVLAPMVNGQVTGTPFLLQSGHGYTLRLHLRCAELLRCNQVFYASVDGTVQRFGDGVIPAALSLVFEVRDEGAASNTPVTVLYDGGLANAPVQASFVAANSVQLFGSIAAVRVARTGTAWISTADPGSGAVSTRLAGSAAEGLDCSLTSSSTGKVTFFPGRVPPAGSAVTIQYRGQRRAVARLADPASLAREAAGGGVGTARWLGKVVRPPARSSADCEAAAQAILSFATNRAAALTGSYTSVNPPGGDIWPGDVLAFNTGGSTSTVIVRKVAIDEHGAAPEALTYRIAFANDWAEGLGLTLSEALAADALLPATAQPGTPAVVPGNLPQLTVVATGSGSTAALTVDAGISPPAGGGFEVRRHDGAFGSGLAGSASGDLVLRSPVRGFSIPRAAFEERFYVRLYDGSVPPLYSRESAAILTHLPLS